MVSLCGCFTFFWWLMMMSIFSYGYWPFIHHWRNAYSDHFPISKIWVVFLLLSCEHFLFFLDTICNYFFHLGGCLFSFLMISFEAQTFWILRKSSLSFSLLLLMLLVSHLRRLWLTPNPEDLVLYFLYNLVAKFLGE